MIEKRKRKGNDCSQVCWRRKCIIDEKEFIVRDRLGTSRVDVTLNRRGTGRGPGAAARRRKVQKEPVTKMSGLFREGQLNLWAGEFRVEGGVIKPYRVTGRD